MFTTYTKLVHLPPQAERRGRRALATTGIVDAALDSSALDFTGALAVSD